MKIYKANYQSPIGNLLIQFNNNEILNIDFNKGGIQDMSNLPPIVNNTIQQLNEYFTGDRYSFNIKYKLKGTDFQVHVWKILSQIPYNFTFSYKQIANQLGDEKKVRAVGTAIAKNPLKIIIPCHRVIGSNNKLVGYSSGIWRKKWLLDFESKNI